MRIYLFRGLLGGVFSRGMDALAEKLTAQGHITSVHRWLEASLIQAQLLTDDEPSDNMTISIIGHSLGANSANYMANDLVDAGFNVKYVATIDATGPRSAPIGPICDNFRSADLRDKAIAGAKEHNFSDLSHTQIDKDERIHKIILNRCGLAVTPTKSESAKANDGNLQRVDHNARTSSVNGIPARPSPIGIENEPELTPINNWLGSRLGKLLNGKKTGIAIFGLLATSILPTVFPASTSFPEILNTIGIFDQAMVDRQLTSGTNISTTFFSAIGAWGILGKIEKWLEFRAARTQAM